MSSSRSDRAKKQAARPEDFMAMDEEDLAELREGRNLVDEDQEMDFGGTEAEVRRRAAGDVEDECVHACRPVHTHSSFSLQSYGERLCICSRPQDFVGARIFRKMGWRQGQGVGPCVTWE